jgi:3-hydroxy-9,10-secoandrosta-1,3,5(10)-triene-9,17-dione monooxygenase
VTLAPPQPDLTPAQMVQRAAEIGPTLVERQAETEERTSYAPDTHEAFREAGFYRLLVPRRYGGYEFDIPTFVRVIMHVSHGCPSTGWQLCLAHAHTLLVASWFEERAQDELFADGDFLCPSVAAPVGRAQRSGDGHWILNGTHRYCSGAPYGTHYLGQTFPPSGDRPMLFVAPRSEWTMLDDWGHTLGLKGSGSNSIVFEDGRIPEHYALEDTVMLDVDNSNGTVGQRLHGNPMYLGRALSFFGLEFGAMVVGMVRGALDEYLELITTKTTHRRPTRPCCSRPSSGWTRVAARWRRACTSMPRRTCGSTRSRRSPSSCAGTQCRSTRSARPGREPPTTASACSASGATCRWFAATSTASSTTGLRAG